MVQDMTVGNPLRLIFKFSIPLLLGNLLQNIYHISDIMIVGRLIDTQALAAVGSSAPIYFVFLLITLGFTGGLTIVTAQQFGAHNPDGVRRSVTHSIIASFVLCLLFTFGMLWGLRPLLQIMNVPTDIFEQAYIFMYYLTCGLTMLVSYNLLSGFIRALGDSKTPLYFLLFSTFLNILLNFCFIYYGKMGIIGSALGTIIAITLSVIFCIIYISKKYPILRLQRNDWKFNSDFMMQHLRVAVPMSLQFSIIAFGVMIIQSICNSFGAETIAAFTAALRIEQLSTQPLLALGLSIATYTAQNYGAGKFARIRRAVSQCALISFGFSIVISLLVRFVGENMIDLFLKEKNMTIIEIAQNYLNISTMFYFFLGMIFIYRNTLQGMGRSDIPLLASVVELGMRAFAAVYLAQSMGYLGICYASPIAWVGGAVVVFTGYHLTIHGLRKKISEDGFYKNLSKQMYLQEGTPAE